MTSATTATATTTNMVARGCRGHAAGVGRARILVLQLVLVVVVVVGWLLEVDIQRLRPNGSAEDLLER